MDFDHVIEVIDEEIKRLQEARAVLARTGIKKGPGRPKAAGASQKLSGNPAAKNDKRKRRLSPEGRRKIAEAMRRRWAERKKQQGSSK